MQSLFIQHSYKVLSFAYDTTIYLNQVYVPYLKRTRSNPWIIRDTEEHKFIRFL